MFQKSEESAILLQKTIQSGELSLSLIINVFVFVFATYYPFCVRRCAATTPIGPAATTTAASAALSTTATFTTLQSSRLHSLTPGAGRAHTRTLIRGEIHQSRHEFWTVYLTCVNFNLLRACPDFDANSEILLILNMRA